MVYESFRGEHNNNLIFNIYEDVVEEMNAEFMQAVKNVPHSYEIKLKAKDIGKLMDYAIDYHISYPIEIQVDMKFLKTYFRGLEAGYDLKQEDKNLPPVAYASLSYRSLREDALYDWLDHGHVH